MSDAREVSRGSQSSTRGGPNSYRCRACARVASVDTQSCGVRVRGAIPDGKIMA